MSEAPLHRAADSDDRTGAGTGDAATPGSNRQYWAAGLREVAAGHRAAAEAARASGDQRAAVLHARAAVRVERVVEDLSLLPLERQDDHRGELGRHSMEA